MSGIEAAPSGQRDRPASADLRRPAISVVVPTCGRHALLARALSSVLGQSYQNWECAVVNDAPAARPTIDALLLELNDSRITAYHNEVNQGAAAARNVGILHTTGRYLAFLDDDDYWLPDHLSGIFAAHETSQAPVLVYTDFIQQWEDDIIAPRLTRAKPPPQNPDRDFAPGELQHRDNVDGLCAQIVHRGHRPVRSAPEGWAGLGFLFARLIALPVHAPRAILSGLLSSFSGSTYRRLSYEISKSKYYHE